MCLTEIFDDCHVALCCIIDKFKSFQMKLRSTVHISHVVCMADRKLVGNLRG